MAKPKTKYEWKPWQRREGSSEGFAQIHHDRLDSPAFHDLTAAQKVLYVYCVRESHGAAMKALSGIDERLFYMNRGLWASTHKLYSRNSDRSFNRDMAALIDHGFVDCVRPSYKMGMKNLYSLSWRWGVWGTDAFEVPEKYKTTWMKRRDMKKKQAAVEEQATEKRRDKNSEQEE